MEQLELIDSFKVGCVIPVGPGEFRLKNLDKVLGTLNESTFLPEAIVLVFDGWEESDLVYPLEHSISRLKNVISVPTPKHEPGLEQPRNRGVRELEKLDHCCNFVWFLDSDCLVGEETLHEFAKASNARPEDRILIGPYDMMHNTAEVIEPGLNNDLRWEMFRQWNPEDIFRGDLGVALGNFSGNLVWPLDEFKRVGGFWNDLYAGRCEDGELGLRAASLGVPMSLVAKARAYHLGGLNGHGDPQIQQKNERDVPMINERHPWVESQGLIVVDEDGKRFNQVCKYCGESINTLEIWSHQKDCYNNISNVLGAKT